MEGKREGIAFPPVPLNLNLPREAAGRTDRLLPDSEPRCEMCGAEVIASHCKRICLRCGFMTGCSEGI
jgi:ribosomal protein S27AE